MFGRSMSRVRFGVLAAMSGAAVAMASLAAMGAQTNVAPEERTSQRIGDGRNNNRRSRPGKGYRASTRHIDYQRGASLRRRMGGKSRARRMAAQGWIWNDAAGRYEPGENNLTRSLKSALITPQGAVPVVNSPATVGKRQGKPAAVRPAAPTPPKPLPPTGAPAAGATEVYAGALRKWYGRRRYVRRFQRIQHQRPAASV